MTGEKTKQLLRILKWQALIASGQDNDKMDVAESFIKLEMLWQGLC